MTRAVAATKEQEPIYGKHYLPRKFKIVIAVPPDNDVDIFAHDLGFIAIVEKGKRRRLQRDRRRRHGHDPRRDGYLPAHRRRRSASARPSRPSTSPRRSSRCSATGATARTASARASSTRSRIAGSTTSAPRSSAVSVASSASRVPSSSTSTGDTHRLEQGADKKWHLTCSSRTAASRIRPAHALRTALREIAELHTGDFVCTANQNVIIANVAAKAKPKIESILKAARRHAVCLVGAAPQQHGLRRAADMRPGAGRERALPARAARPRSRTCSTKAGLQRRRHRHPHDRLPQRLRAAVSRRDRPRRPQSRAYTTSISVRPSTVRGSTSSTPRTWTGDRSCGCWSRFRALRQGARGRRAFRRLRRSVRATSSPTTAGNTFHADVTLVKVRAAATCVGCERASLFSAWSSRSE